MTSNLSIAEFMGGSADLESYRVNFPIKNGVKGIFITDLKYDCDWKWLMPVVEKIEEIRLPSPSIVNVRVDISGTTCRIFKGEWNDSKEGFISKYFQVDEKGTKIKSTYKAVVAFIEWYNTNIKDNKYVK